MSERTDESSRAWVMTRRAAVGAMAAAGLGFVALGPRGVDPRARGRVVLNYWEKWTGQEADAMRRVVDRFNDEQDRIYVKYFSMSFIEQKSMIAVAAGDPPDLVGLGSWDVPIFAETRALMPLEDRLSAAGLGPAYYAPPVRQLARHDGHTWGVPNTCSTIALYYNRAAFREAGLDPDRPPRTIEELDEYAGALTREDASGRLTRAGFLHREPGWWNWHWGYSFGGTLLREEENRATAASAENVEAYRWVQSYPAKYGAERLTRFHSQFRDLYNSRQQGLISGKVAMTIHGPFLVNVIRAFAPEFDYGAAPFPVRSSIYDPGAPVGMLESDVLAIPRGTRHPEEAFEFLRYTQRRDVVEEMAVAHCKPSPLAETSPTFAARHPNRYIEMHNGIVRSPRAFLVPRTRIWPLYKKEFDTKIAPMWDLSERAEDVLAGIERRAQEELDRVAEKRALRAKAS